ncbi:MAG: hypothetical protein F4X66_11905 [Chloroflexi bacterium]|nr:hypothetical protein [Chloroflexota bacterium]
MRSQLDDGLDAAAVGADGHGPTTVYCKGGCSLNTGETPPRPVRRTVVTRLDPIGGQPVCRLTTAASA